MKKILIIILAILIIPMALIAGLNFGLIKTAKKRVDKVDEKVGVIKKTEQQQLSIASNRSPVISSIFANPTTVSTGAVSAITCSASDADGDILTYTWSAASGTISGTSSTINWTAPASSSTYAINVTVSDGHGGSIQSSVNIAVTKANNSPKISSVVANPTTISTGAVSAITCTASDADSDTLTYTWSAASGTISGTGATINWTAPASSSTYTINVTVSDGHGSSAQSSVNIAVTKANNSPKISSVVANPTTISTGAVSAITCTASDADGDTLTYTWSAASGTISGTGSTINWTAPASSATYTVSVTVSDGHGGSAHASVNIVSTRGNISPIISSLVANPTTVSTGAASGITCTASDADGDPLTYTWSAASGTITATGATINWKAPASSSTYVINVAVTDGHGGLAHASINVVVTKLNNLPTIWSLVANPISISTGAVTVITISTSDLDGDTLTTTWSAASGTISGIGATITWKAPVSSSTYVINATVADGHGGSAQATVNVQVLAWATYTTANSGLAGNVVLSIAIDNLGNPWFGSWGGVSKFNGTNWTTYTSGFASNRIQAIAIDNLGNKWFGTYAGGVSKFDGTNWTTYTTTNGLVNNVVNSIAIDSSGNKWFGTEGGVSKFDGTNWTNYTTVDGLAINGVVSIAIDDLGNKWFGTDGGGISKYDGTNWTTYTSANSGLVNYHVQAIAIDSLGNKWFGTAGGGILKYDGTNWTTYTTVNGLAHNDVFSIAIDGSGNKWFGTYNGVSKYDGTNWTTYKTVNGLVTNEVRSIAIDGSGYKWFGTDGGGVSKLW